MLNKLQLIGHLGRDPEVRYTQNGRAVARMSLATSESWTDRETGERKERTDWHIVIAWGSAADFAGRYLTTGSRVFVEGPLRTREWTDSDGNKRRTKECTAKVLLGLDRRQRLESPDQATGEDPPPGRDLPPSRPEDDIPF